MGWATSTPRSRSTRRASFFLPLLRRPGDARLAGRRGDQRGHAGLRAALRLGRELRSPYFAPLVGQRTSWKYRGQILPSAGLMRLEVHISRIERRDGQIVLRADASLWRDQLRIYEVRELGLTIVEG